MTFSFLYLLDLHKQPPPVKNKNRTSLNAISQVFVVFVHSQVFWHCFCYKLCECLELNVNLSDSDFSPVVLWTCDVTKER